jgi:hypothetical protein
MKRILFAVLLVAGLLRVASAQDHVELGVYGDYFRLSQTDTNMAGLSERLAVTVEPPVSLEAEMNYDFEQAFTEEFTNSGSGTITTLVLLCYKLSAAPYAANGAARELLEKVPRELDSDGRDGIGIMTFGARAASRGA